MKISERSKFWLVTSLIIIAGFLGGILGNWIFIYMLDKYYGIAAGNYAAAPTSSNIVIRQSSRPATSSGIEAAAAVEKSLVGIFKHSASPTYLPSTKVAQGIVITSDGWVVTSSAIPADKNGTWADYVVIAGGHSYSIDRVVIDVPSQLSFIHLKKANSLPVRDFISLSDITPFQTVYGIEWQGSLEAGLLGRYVASIRSSDTAVLELSVTGFSGRNVAVFDQAGRIIALSRGRSIIGIDVVKALTDKLLSDGKIVRPRFGIRYATVSSMAGATQDGALITSSDKTASIIPDSPAAKAGLRDGDIITHIDDIQLGPETDLASLLIEYKPGESVKVNYLRGAEKKETTVKLDALNEK